MLRHYKQVEQPPEGLILSQYSNRCGDGGLGTGLDVGHHASELLNIEDVIANY